MKFALFLMLSSRIICEQCSQGLFSFGRTAGVWDSTAPMTNRGCHDMCVEIYQHKMLRDECHKCCRESDRDNFFRCRGHIKSRFPQVKSLKNRNKILGKRRPQQMPYIDSNRKISV